MTDAPADVRNGRGDILAANRLGYALYSELYIDPVRPANVARFLFLSPRAQEFFPDWESTANDLVASLRTAAGRNPHDRGCRTWSGSCRPAARSSAAGGRPTTCACTRLAASGCITRSSGTSI